jgi:hypothetical protein
MLYDTMTFAQPEHHTRGGFRGYWQVYLVGVFMISGSATTISMAYAQTVVLVPRHTHAYMIGAKNGSAAAKIGVYDVGAACTPFTGNDLEHCIAGYYDTLAGYHDARLAIHNMKAVTSTGGTNMTNMTRSNMTGGTR